MKKILSAVLLLCAGINAGAQEGSSLWHQAPAGYAAGRGLPELRPERFEAFTVAEPALREYLSTAPTDPVRGLVIDLPLPGGGFRSFRVWETPVMEPALAKKYPGIRTYTAEAVGNSQTTAKIDYSPAGFHAMVFDAAGTYFIDPYGKEADGSYIAYFKRDYSRPGGAGMACEVGSGEAPHSGETILSGNGLPALRLYGTVRKTYRLALACTGEYAAAVATTFPPTKAHVLTKMITTLNRVNGVYERELAVTMQLIANEDTLIFLDGTTDPYTNSSGSAMLGENQGVIDTRVGSANYDIGHVFSTGGGGIAFRGSVCQATVKARGVTGSPNPVGDAFDIDFVSHEIGHQFGADHTFNANTGSCAGNGAPNTAYEPGSGSTIMAYAGICGGGNDFQGNSDPYFHSASLEQITDYITLPRPGGSCPATVASSNANATMPAYAATYAIPFRTPFELTAPTAADVTSDTLTYCWEQRNLGDFRSSLVQTRLNGPLFRSRPPVTSPTRVFPDPARFLFGLPLIGEKLPDTGRTLAFRFTERDVYQGWGTFNFPEEQITLQVIHTGSAFTVSSPAGGETWIGGDLQTVTWNVVGTNAGAVNCPNVDIYLSVDGGYTWPYLVKAGTPNDGTEVVRLPNPETTFNARIKVKGSGNVFFNVSPVSFTLEKGTVGVGAHALADQITIAPVPAKDQVQITAPSAIGRLQVRVVNTLGQAVWTGTMQEKLDLPVRDWAAGIYHVQLFNESAIQTTRKIVVE